MTLRKSWSTPQWKYQSLSDHSVFTQKLKNQSRFVVLKSSFWATEISHLTPWDGTGELLTRYTGFDDPVIGGVCWTPSSTSALQQTSKLGLVAETENEGRTPEGVLLYPHINSHNWSPCISIKSNLREFDKRPKHFPSGDYFITVNSQ